MPPPYSAGSVFLQVVPSYEGVQEDIKKHAERFGKMYGETAGDAIGQELKNRLPKHVDDAMKGADEAVGRAGGRAGKKYGDGFAREASAKTGKELVRALDRTADDAGKSGEKSAKSYAGKFANTLRQQLAAMEKQVLAIRVDADDSEAYASLGKIKAAIAGMQKAKIGVDFSAEDAAEAVLQMEKLLDTMSKEAVSLRTRVDADQAAKEAGVLRKIVETVLEKPVDIPVTVDARQLGAFETQLKGSLAAALKAMPPLDLDDSPAAKKVREIRARIQTLSDARIGIDISGEDALTELARIQAIVQDLNRSGVDIKTRYDSAQLLAALDQAQERVNKLDGSKANIDVFVKKVDVEEKASERLVGNFERTFRKSIETALNNLPPLDLDVDDASVTAEVDRIRRELATLRDARLGIDLSSDDALARLRTLMGELQRLDGETADVKVRSDVGTAYKELRSTFELVEKLEGKDAKVKVSATGAATAAGQLRAVNKEADKTSSNGLDAANAFRAFNGRIFAFVALAPAAIPLLAGIAGGLAAIGPAAIAGVAGLGVAAMGFSGIGAAVKGLNDVETNAVKDSASRAKTMRGAARGVRDAEQALARARQDGADAVADAGRRVEDALRSQEDAEQRLVDAQRAATRAQQDLIAARSEAQDQLEDLQLRARGGALAERQAALDLAQAQADYISTFADGSSTNVEREQAAIALEREKIGYEEAVLANQRLAEQKAAADATGIEGTEAYQRALDGVAGANRDVEDAQDGVADAQRGVADAQRDAARASRDASQSIADATQSLTDAQSDYQDALTQTEDIGTSSMSKLEEAMKKLGPAGQNFARFLYGLKPYWEDLRRNAQEGFLPGLQNWMSTITGFYGPALLRTVSNLSGALGDVFTDFGTALMSKPFADLFAMIENDGPRFVRTIGSIFTNFGSGIASLMVAFVPFTDLVLGWFQDISGEFARWAASLQGSSGLQSFFDYVKRIGPEVGDFLLALGDALVNLGVALAPYGEVILNILTGFLDIIGDMDPAALGAITIGILGLVTAMQTIFGLTSLVKSAEAAWHLATGTLGGFAGKIPLMTGGIIALAVGLATLYMNSEDFRGLVDSIAGAISDMIGWINGAVGPIGVLVAAIAGLFIAKQAAGWLSALRGPTSQLGTAADFLGAGFGGATGKVGALKGALGGMTGMLGGPWGIAMAGAALLIGGISKSLADAKAQTDTWAQAWLDGGAAAQSAMREYQAARDKQPTEWMADLDEWTGLAGSIDDAKKKADEMLGAMNPLQRAQQEVTTATNELAFAQDQYGTESAEAMNASNNLAGAQKNLETKQRDLEVATDNATTALLDQANAILGAANSDIAFSNAQIAANRSADAYKKVMADSAATVDDRTEAENNLKSSFLNVAGAALRQAEDQAKLRGETLTATDQAGIQLKAMHDLADAMGIELPESIGSLITGFEDTAGKAVAAAGAVDGVTGAIQVMPGGKEVVLSALDQPARDTLTALGVRVEEQPDGSIALFADDDPAQQILDAFVAEGNTRQITVGITGSWIGSFIDGIITGKPMPGAVVVTPGAPTDKGSLPGLPRIPRATGGPIVGPGTATSDSVPILASDGEYMIKASSVSKYGLQFMDLINAGRFATGGLIGAAPTSIPRWTTPTDVSALDTSPLAAMWGDAIDAIGTVSSDAAPLLASMWAALSASAQTSVAGLRDGATATWTEMHDDITGTTDSSLAATEQRFRDMDATVGQVVGGTRDTLRDVWGDLRNVTADPVNFVISNVLNAGLFAALNSVASTFGLDKTVPPATPITVPRFATGGRVPGFSPTKTADNVLAQLTAGEFVQPVDSVQYYGADFMEAIRLRRIPKGILPAYATGGQVGSWRQLDAIRAQMFPGSIRTSGYRPGARDHHGAGNAIDIGVPGNSPSLLAPIARRIAMAFPNSLELINNPGGSIKNGRVVPSSFWGPATWAAHANHVHWAATAAQIAAGALGSTDIPSALSASIMQPIADLFGGFGKSSFVQLLADSSNAVADNVWMSLIGGDDSGDAPEPTLYDDGGYLPPGLSMVMNGTGRPEPVLTAEELSLLREGGRDEDRGDSWDVDFNEVMADPDEILGNLWHAVRARKRRGKYATAGGV